MHPNSSERKKGSLPLRSPSVVYLSESLTMQTMRSSTLSASRNAAVVAHGRAAKPRAVARVTSASATREPSADDAQVDHSRRGFLASGAFSIFVPVDRKDCDRSKGAHGGSQLLPEEMKKYERRDRVC